VFGVCSISPAIESPEKIQSLPARLDEAIDVALHNRVEVAIASRQRTSSEIRTKVSRGNFYPKISMSGTSKYTRSFDKFSGIAADATLGNQSFHVIVQKEPPVYELSAGLDLTYNIFSGGQDVAALEETIAEYTAQQHEESATKARVALEVMNAYWTLRKSQILSGLAERAYLHEKKMQKIAETRRASGLISQIDVEAGALSVQEAELALDNARHDEGRNLAKYHESLGLGSVNPQSSAGPSVFLVDDPEKITEVELLPATERPETLKLKSEAVAAEARVKQSKAPYLPKIDFFATYKIVGRDNDDYFRSGRVRSDYYAVGVTLSFTLFDGFKDRIALAKSEEVMARLNIEQTVKELESKNKDKMTEKEKLQKEATLSERRVNLYNLKKKLAKEKYKNGEISEIELYEAEKNYDDISDKLLIAKIDVVMAKQSLSLNSRTW